MLLPHLGFTTLRLGGRPKNQNPRVLSESQCKRKWPPLPWSDGHQSASASAVRQASAEHGAAKRLPLAKCRTMLLGQDVREFLFEELLRLGADDCALHFAALEQVHGGNGGDAVLSSD